MSEVRIAAEPRTEFGKGAARRVRRANKVPAVLYGHGDEPRHFSLPGHELMLALKADANVLLTLETEGGDQLALPKVVVRHPTRGTLEHVDLLAVRKGEKVAVDVPVTVTGEAGGDTLVDVQQTTVHVEADLEASEAELGAGATAAASTQQDVDADGSESDAAGEGDVVGETEAPKS
ncbi:MAG TPA: 50S ribosomal protein L25, partial [Mycobacteriales bacterium]|nr:50S ribosomal protein L25 [Mycobacteriales bacterium]